MQSIHSRYFTGKVFISGALLVLMGKAPALAGAFFDSALIIAGRAELVRYVDLSDFNGVMVFRGLTEIFRGEETRTKTKYRDLSTAQRTIRPSVAPVEMTFVLGLG